MYDPDSGGKYYFNRQSGDKEWVAGAKAQLDRIQQEAGGAPPFMGMEKMVRPPPPTLEEYLQKMFLDHGNLQKDYSSFQIFFSFFMYALAMQRHLQNKSCSNVSKDAYVPKRYSTLNERELRSVETSEILLFVIYSLSCLIPPGPSQ